MTEKQTIRKDQVLWKTDKFIIYRKDDGSVWRYMPEFKSEYPVIFVEEIKTESDSWEDL